ncbi:serine/threonine-protein phosphatase [bacterium]|nr:serine/threonine-protein phosphatase [bacterium]
MTAIIQWFTATDKGTLRKVNEDSVQIYPEHEDLIREPLLMPSGGRMCIVADGMGGHRGGQEASQTAVRRIAQYYYNQKGMSPDQALRAAVVQTGHDILAIGQSDPELQQMGTTVVAVAALNGNAYVVNVGDSRAYLLRNRQLMQISVDDSWVQQQVQMKTLTIDQARTHLQRNLLIQFLGSKQELNPHLYPLSLQDGDIFLLCTDGVFDVISQEAMIQMFSVPPHQLPQVPHQMIEQAMLNGTSDNVTVAVGYYGSLIRNDTRVATPPTPDHHQRGAGWGGLGLPFSLQHILLGAVALVLLGVLLGFMGFALFQNSGSSLNSEPPPLSPTAVANSIPLVPEDAETNRDGGSVPDPASATLLPMTVTLPLLTVLPVTDATVLDEDGQTAYTDCNDSGIIVSRPQAGTSDVVLKIDTEDITIPAGSRWHPACVPFSGSNETQAVADAVTKTVPNEGVQWVEYAEDVTIYQRNGDLNSPLTEKEINALRRCHLNKPEDAAVVVVARADSNQGKKVIVNGGDFSEVEFDTIGDDSISTACSMDAKIMTISLEGEQAPPLNVTLQPRHYYVVRLDGNGQ